MSTYTDAPLFNSLVLYNNPCFRMDQPNPTSLDEIENVAVRFPSSAPSFSNSALDFLGEDVVVLLPQRKRVDIPNPTVEEEEENNTVQFFRTVDGKPVGSYESKIRWIA